jgi:Flp pilus assembly pilin Flp
MPWTLRAPRNRYGQGLVEYALIVALIGVGLAAILVTLRNSVGNSFDSTSNRVDEVGSCGYAASGGCAAGELPGGGDGDGGSGPGGNDGNGADGGNGGGNGNGNNGNGNGNGGGNGSNGGGNGNGNNGNGNGNGGSN